MLPAAAQAGNASWLKTLTPEPVKGNSPAKEYQRQVAGENEYPIPTGLKDAPGEATRSRMFADGYRPADGAVLEAKYTGIPDNCSPNRTSPYDIRHIQADAAGEDVRPWARRALDGQRFEMERYAAAERFDPVHVRQVEVIINNPVLNPYFRYLMDESHVHGWIRVELAK